MGASEKKTRQKKWNSLRVKCLQVQTYDGATILPPGVYLRKDDPRRNLPPATRQDAILYIYDPPEDTFSQYTRYGSYREAGTLALFGEGDSTSVKDFYDRALINRDISKKRVIKVEHLKDARQLTRQYVGDIAVPGFNARTPPELDYHVPIVQTRSAPVKEEYNHGVVAVRNVAGRNENLTLVMVWSRGGLGNPAYQDLLGITKLFHLQRRAVVAGGRIWGVGMRSSGGNHGRSNKREFPRMQPVGRKRTSQMDPYAVLMKDEETDKVLLPAGVDSVKEFRATLRPIWSSIAAYLGNTFGAMYATIRDEHNNARLHRDIDCFACPRNLLAETEFVHANMSAKGLYGNARQSRNRGTQICVHTDKAMHPIAPIVWVPMGGNAPRSARFGFPHLGKHGVYLDVNCTEGIAILCNITIPHGSSSFDVDWEDGHDLCGIEFSISEGARHDDRKSAEDIKRQKRRECDAELGISLKRSDVLTCEVPTITSTPISQNRGE